MPFNIYDRKVSEVFGYHSDASSVEALSARTEYLCPFLQSRCVKPSQHRAYPSDIPFGACSVWHRGAGVAEPRPYIICPVRFTQNLQIFKDASEVFHQNLQSEIIVVPEISLPMGRIDYVLAQYDSNSNEILDFLVLEVMACSTTSTGDVLKSFHSVLNGNQTEGRLKYGINFRQILSRMMVQVLAKAYACEKWHKTMIWSIQDVLYRYIQDTTKIDLTQLPTNTGPYDFPILIFVYGLDYNNKDQFTINIREVHGGNKESFFNIFEPTALPNTDKLINVMLNKIKNSNSVFGLDSIDPKKLVVSASQLVAKSTAE